MTSAPTVADALALVAIAVSVLSLIVSLRKQERDVNLSFVRALEGGIGSVAYVAAVIRQTGRVAKEVDKAEITAALCRGRNRVQSLNRAVHGAVPETLAAR
ncbi:MAG TPA: hypothetical protein VEU30_01920 [Thermoanaerobaculia bacterium]|nr:hypothetical protein [Thermoanaerobaculia bacterium]